MRGLEQIPLLYDGYMALADRIGLWKLRAWLTTGAKGFVVEIGCGTGRNLTRYPADTRVFGVDPLPDALRRARRRAPSAMLVCASAEALPFARSSFDTAVFSLVLCSVPNPLAALAEVRRILKSDGSLRMLEHVRSDVPWQARLQDLIQPLWTRVTGGCHPNRETETAVRGAGFRIDVSRANGNLRRLVAR